MNKKLAVGLALSIFGAVLLVFTVYQVETSSLDEEYLSHMEIPPTGEYALKTRSVPLSILGFVFLFVGSPLLVYGLVKPSKTKMIPCPGCNQPMKAKIQSEKPFKLEFYCVNPNCELHGKFKAKLNTKEK